MKRLIPFLVVLFACSLGWGQAQTTFSCNKKSGTQLTAANQYCIVSTGTGVVTSGTDTHNVYIYPVGASAINVIIQGSAKGDFSDVATCGSASTTTTPNLLSCSGVYSAVRVKLVSITGAGAYVSLTYIGTSSVVKVHDSNSPTGPAGGDLDGTYPDPTVVQVNGAAVPASAAYVGTNSSGQIIAATNPSVPILCSSISGGVPASGQCTATLTSTQLLHLKATPVTVIPAQGANKVIMIHDGMAQYVFGTTPYTVGGGNLALLYATPDDAGGWRFSATGFIDQSANSFQQLWNQNWGSDGFGVSLLQADDADQALQVRNDYFLSEWSDGDGTVNLTLSYNIYTLP